ncbi:hypothetical protein [Fodinicola feengrottensis]|uniref:hypothetical protein n=1 Tax=Fodinicola feengrottensis TaxID=435914 RepID=UPI0013D8DC19|nr:hypothetical protein [Fodinicola feengrottensis]
MTTNTTGTTNSSQEPTYPLSELPTGTAFSCLEVPAGIALSRTGADDIRVATKAGLRSMPADTRVQLLQQEPSLRMSIRAIIDDAADERVTQRATIDETLDAIRRYAIGQYEDDDIERSGLDNFLDRFSMAAYDPRLDVEITIKARVTVNDLDREETNDARYDPLTVAQNIAEDFTVDWGRPCR